MGEPRKQLRACLQKLATDSVRLDKSPLSQQAAGQDLRAAIATASGEATVLQELLNLVCAGGKFSDHSYVEALEACTGLGMRFPAAFHFKKCAATLGQALSVDDIDKVVKTGHADSVDVQALIDSGVHPRMQPLRLCQAQFKLAC